MHFSARLWILHTAECADGDLKLLGGSSNKEGALQVCYYQRWGTISGDGWTAVDTLVACRQLGFNSTGKKWYPRPTVFF